MLGAMPRVDDLVISAPGLELRPLLSFRVPLDGRLYGVALTFNIRDRAWYLSIADDGGEDVVQGIRVCAGVSLLGDIVRPGLPPGQLYVESSINPPGRYDWRSVARLYYRPAAVVELAAGTADQVF